MPISVVNAEYLNSKNISWTWLNTLGRNFGFPFVPVGAVTLQALLPATYLTAAPAKLTYVVHEPIDFSTRPLDATRKLSAETEQFRQLHQARLDASVRQYHAPYNSKARILGDPSIDPYLKPAQWHQLFLNTAGDPSWLAALYKIPLGCPIIWLGRQFLQKR